MRIIILLIFVVMCSSAYATKWDVEYWQFLNLKNWESGKYQLYTRAELRANRDLSRMYYYRIAENIVYQALPWLDLQGHYSFIYQKPRGAAHFTTGHRVDLETNLLFHLHRGIDLRIRNRVEINKRQQVSHIQFVSRNRAMVSFLQENRGMLTSVDVYDEFFYDFDTSKFNENRLVPIQLSLSFSRRVHLNLFLMVRHFFTSSKWYRSIVLGTELEF